MKKQLISTCIAALHSSDFHPLDHCQRRYGIHMTDKGVGSPRNGQTRLAYILGVPLAEKCVRQWPQMEELVRGRELIETVEENFKAATLEVVADCDSGT